MMSAWCINEKAKDILKNDKSNDGHDDEEGNARNTRNQNYENGDTDNDYTDDYHEHGQ